MYKLLKDSLKIRRYLLVTILVIQFISVILSTLLPYMNGMFVDMLIDIKNVEEVIKYAITIAGVGIISLFLSYIYNLKIMKVKRDYNNKFRIRMYESPEMYSLAQDGQRGSVAANTNWVGNAEGVANAIGYANAAVATLAGVAVVVLAVVGAVFTVK